RAQQGRIPRQGDRARQSSDRRRPRRHRLGQQVGVTRALVIVALAAGCGSRPALDYGRALFDDASVSSAASNSFKCSTCHEVTATATTVHPGYTLYDSTVRPAWWGGTVSTLFDATNQCITEFMRGKPLGVNDDKGRALFVYLQSVSP